MLLNSNNPMQYYVKMNGMEIGPFLSIEQARAHAQTSFMFAESSGEIPQIVARAQDGGQMLLE